MFFYHGTTEIISNIDFEKCRLRTDFGKGFYLSIKRAKALPSVFQMSLHTASALNYIIGVMISERKDNKWSEWRDI